MARGNARRVENLEKIRGELVDWRVRGADAWGTGKVRTAHDGGEVDITGTLVGVSPGETVELEGVWSEHPRWGRQFKAKSATVIAPQDAAGVISWLASVLPQISSRRAEAMVSKLGINGVWRVLDERDIDALCTFDGVTPPRATEIVEAYHQHKELRDQTVTLKAWGLTDNQVGKLRERYGSKLVEELRRDPYRLILDVRGFGWKRADELALRMGVRKDSPSRIRAGIIHWLNEAAAAGHCWMRFGKLVGVVCGAKVLGIGAAGTDAVSKELRAAGASGVVLIEDHRVSLPHIAEAEITCAEAIATRAKKGR